MNLCYDNDTLDFWIQGKEKHETSVKDFKNFTPIFGFIYESRKKNISLLTLNATLPYGELITNLNIISTDHHHFIRSYHPEKTKGSIVYSQILRTSRPYSKNKDFQQHLLDMKSVMHRGYRENVIDSEMSKAVFYKEEGL